jgi:NAD(P)-dependent dehydrogenase (short-subunit alcohol dehydrogenase family)
MTPLADKWEEAVPGTVAAISAQIPLGRPAQPEEVAEAAAWLLSDRSSYVSGVTVPVTGASGV